MSSIDVVPAVQGIHDDDRRDEEVEIRAAEARQVLDAPEELAEQDEVDERLHEQDRDVPRLADEEPDVATGDRAGVGEGGGHDWASLFAIWSAAAKERPVWRR